MIEHTYYIYALYNLSVMRTPQQISLECNTASFQYIAENSQIADLAYISAALGQPYTDVKGSLCRQPIFRPSFEVFQVVYLTKQPL